MVADSNSVIRVKGTRVTLDTVAQAFERGATAEEIAQQYPTLSLADVYAVLGYLLGHQAKVTACLEERATRCTALRKDNEHRFDPGGGPARGPTPGTAIDFRTRLG